MPTMPGMETGNQFMHAYVLKCERNREAARRETEGLNAEQGRGPIGSRSELEFTKSLRWLWQRLGKSGSDIDSGHVASCEHASDRVLSGHPMPGDRFCPE